MRLRDNATSLSFCCNGFAALSTLPPGSRLVTLYRPLVLSWCQRAGVGPEDAADVAQDVFLAVAEGVEQFQRRREGGFRSWVRGITRHKLLDFYRRQGRQLQPASGGTDAFQALQEIADPEHDSAPRLRGKERPLPGAPST